MTKGTSVYFCDPFHHATKDETDPSARAYQDEILNVDDVLDENQRRLYDAAVLNRRFGAVYKNFTGGSEWLANYPSQPPQHHMWRADYFGQQHAVQTMETQFTALPPTDALHKLSIPEMQRHDKTKIALPEYRAEGPWNITLTVVSVEPRILQIDNFLSDVEVDQYVEALYFYLVPYACDSNKYSYAILLLVFFVQQPARCSASTTFGSILHGNFGWRSAHFHRTDISEYVVASTQ